eukprot:TRINITY_DN11760_c0_g1_i1.p1 TRINITY_DN11760_c0_g1~~TRINITY_DN11760_c0_g1_i1.p1  ORF type:complete len:229 (+),score=72.55 TRINITY_DN11760_c0_g1_i1:72-758(+)
MSNKERKNKNKRGKIHEAMADTTLSLDHKPEVSKHRTSDGGYELDRELDDQNEEVLERQEQAEDTTQVVETGTGSLETIETEPEEEEQENTKGYESADDEAEKKEVVIRSFIRSTNSTKSPKWFRENGLPAKIGTRTQSAASITPPYSAHYPNQQQNRYCGALFLTFQKCLADHAGADEFFCREARANAYSMCPPHWIANWQAAEATDTLFFPGRGASYKKVFEDPIF